jgi:TIR domain
MSDKTHVFISYAHQDTIIAHAIRDQLTLLAQNGAGAPSLNCFLDTESIEPGRKFEPIIKAALEDADWLIVVFTGDQSVYCGYEIGMYSILKPHADLPTQEKPVAWLHDVDKNRLPAVVNGYSTTLISQIAAYLPDPPNQLTSDAKLWWDSSVGKLLRAICGSKGLYTPHHRSADPSQYQIDIAQAASKIAHAFEIARLEDEVSDTPVQAALELVVFPPFKGEQSIPAQSDLIGSSRAFEILGLNVPHSLAGQETPHLSWGELRQALARPERANIPLLDRLESNISLAPALKVPKPDDVTLRGSGQDRRIYRALLNHHKLYRNGKRRFYILLVETFDRRFAGDPDTSLLLTALMLASRWRFTFFERWHDTLRQFDSSRSDADFVDACRQLEYNMEWIENEGVELGANDPDAMVQAFGNQHKARVERFYTDFYSAKSKMNSRLPATLEILSPQTRSEVQAAIVEFLTTVRDQNNEFLKLCVRAYANKVDADLDCDAP